MVIQWSLLSIFCDPLPLLKPVKDPTAVSNTNFNSNRLFRVVWLISSIWQLLCSVMHEADIRRSLCLETYDETIFVRWVEFNAQTPMEYHPLLEVLSQVLWVYLLPELQLWVCFLCIVNARRMYIRSQYLRSHVKVCYCGDPFTSH